MNAMDFSRSSENFQEVANLSSNNIKSLLDPRNNLKQSRHCSTTDTGSPKKRKKILSKSLPAIHSSMHSFDISECGTVYDFRHEIAFLSKDVLRLDRIAGLRDCYELLNKHLVATNVDKQNFFTIYYPNRFLQLYGPQGCGKSTLVKAVCLDLRIPMICIKNDLNCRDSMKDIYTLAKSIEPCVIYFEDCGYNLRAGNNSSAWSQSIKYGYRSQCTVQRNNIWTIFGTVEKPCDLSPILQRLIGDAFALAKPPDKNARIKFFQEAIKSMGCVPSVKNGDFREWEKLIQDITVASECCSYDEINEYFRRVYLDNVNQHRRMHRDGLQLKRNIPFPTIAIFRKNLYSVAARMSVTKRDAKRDGQAYAISQLDVLNAMYDNNNVQPDSIQENFISARPIRASNTTPVFVSNGFLPPPASPIYHSPTTPTRPS